MYLVFCCDPMNMRQPDMMYETEVEAARQTGLEYGLISYEALVQERNAAKAVSRIPEQSQERLGIYRGWMLTPEQYERLYAALLQRGLRLINDPAAYKHCHYLPESYPIIEPFTPKSVWLPTSTSLNFEQIMNLLRPFGTKPIIVKDYVKSQKHYWYEACYIPSAADREAVERVVSRFVQLQGDEFNEGLVFREFMTFEPLGVHPKSAMPITQEFRLFFVEGAPLYSTAYWADVTYPGERPPIDAFSNVAQKIQSRFFTMDIAKNTDGRWMIVELGDGQVAGLLETADPLGFYTALKMRAEGFIQPGAEAPG